MIKLAQMSGSKRNRNKIRRRVQRFPNFQSVRRLQRSAAAHLALLALPAAIAAAAILAAGCEEPSLNTSTDAPRTTPTSTAPSYKRQTLSYFKGIDEPEATAWDELVLDQERLLKDGFNIASLAPPVLISQRAGGQPRLILEGDAGSVPGLTEDLHAAGLAVFISPTTAAPGYKVSVETTEPVLEQLTADAGRWAATAEEKQAELFTPLADYNLALGTETANAWSARTLPLVKQKFTGGVVARVATDISGSPPAGAPHDFEKLDYRGYDYLMLDFSPPGENLNQAQLEASLTEVLDRADAIVRRDGLKGVLLGFGAWRAMSGADPVDGPVLGDDGQAQVAEDILKLTLPRLKGFFWHGWTLGGRGARGFKVEEVLRHGFAGV